MITKHFWKTIKPFLLHKVTSTSKLKLIDKEGINAGDYNNGNVLNIFFSNIVSNLNMKECLNCEALANNITSLV